VTSWEEKGNSEVLEENRRSKILEGEMQQRNFERGAAVAKFWDEKFSSEILGGELQ
jgi:hypothetical protein